MEPATEPAEMSRALVQAVYDGPGLAEHAMEVADFAPALLAVAETCQRANYLLNGNKTKLSVQIRAEVIPGCFQVDLNLIVLTAGYWIPLIPSYVEPAMKIADAVFGENHSLFDIIRRLGKHEEPKEVTYSPTGDVTFVIPGDNNHITVNNSRYKIIADKPARRSAVKAMRVLRRPGIDTLKIGTKGNEVSITKNDALALSDATTAATQGEEVLESEREAILDVIAFATHPEQKSHFSEGDGADLWATIDDAAFWERYHTREYGYHDRDRFRVNLVTRQLVGEKLKTEHIITDVFEVIEPT